MKIVVTIGRNGQIESSHMVPDDTVSVYFNSNAAKVMRHNVLASRSACQRCQNVFMTHDTETQECQEGSGCKVDIDNDLFLLNEADFHVAMNGLAVRLFSTAKRTLAAVPAVEGEGHAH